MERRYKRTTDLHLQPTELHTIDENLLIMFYKMNNLEDLIEDEANRCESDEKLELIKKAVEIRDFILMMLEGRLGYHSLEDFYNSGEIIHYNRKGTPLTYMVQND